MTGSCTGSRACWPSTSSSLRCISHSTDFFRSAARKGHLQSQKESKQRHNKFPVFAAAVCGSNLRQQFEFLRSAAVQCALLPVTWSTQSYSDGCMSPQISQAPPVRSFFALPCLINVFCCAGAAPCGVCRAAGGGRLHVPRHTAIAVAHNHPSWCAHRLTAAPGNGTSGKQWHHLFVLPQQAENSQGRLDDVLCSLLPESQWRAESRTTAHRMCESELETTMAGAGEAEWWGAPCNAEHGAVQTASGAAAWAFTLIEDAPIPAAWPLLPGGDGTWLQGSAGFSHNVNEKRTARDASESPRLRWRARLADQQGWGTSGMARALLLLMSRSKLWLGSCVQRTAC